MKKQIQNILTIQRMLKLAEEVKTTDGINLKVVGKFEVGEEVATEDEDGNIVDAPDGTYTTDSLIITVQGGIITGIQQIEPESVEEPTEETPVEENLAEEEETPNVEEPKSEEPNEVDELKEKLAAAEAKIAELEAKLAAAEAKLEEPAADPINEKKEKFSAETDNKTEKLSKMREAIRRMK